MPISKDEVRRIARLAHLEHPRIQDKNGAWIEPPELLFDDETLERMAAEIGNILDHVKELDLVEVEGVEGTSHGVPLPALFDEDVARPGLSTERALAAAPARTGASVSVPKIIE